MTVFQEQSRHMLYNLIQTIWSDQSDTLTKFGNEMRNCMNNLQIWKQSIKKQAISARFVHNMDEAKHRANMWYQLIGITINWTET